MHLAVPNKDSNEATYCTSLHSQTSAYPLHYTVTQAIGRAHGLEVAWRGLSQQIILGSLHCVITQPCHSVFRPVDCRAKIGQDRGGLSLSSELRALTLTRPVWSVFVVKGSFAPVSLAAPSTPSFTGPNPISTLALILGPTSSFWAKLCMKLLPWISWGEGVLLSSWSGFKLKLQTECSQILNVYHFLTLS